MLPGAYDEYLRGKRKQALRTNLRKAHATMVCHELAGHDAETLGGVLSRHDDRRRPLDVRLQWWSEELSRTGNRGWFVTTTEGEPLALALVTVDREVAYLQAMVGVDRIARWYLHTHIVETVHAAGVRTVVTHSINALLLEPSIQGFQHLLGYSIVNLSVRTGTAVPTAVT